MAADRKAFVVVHGIGDQDQRATLEAFVGCCNQGEQPASGATQLVRSPAVGSQLRPFSYFVQETSIGGKPAVVAEMYWSDLSRINTGFLAPVRNFFNLMVAAPSIIYAGLGPKVSPDGAQHDYLSLRILRSLVALAFWTLFVVGAAYCLTFTVLFLAFVLDLRVLRPGLELQAQINPLLAPILVIVAGFGGFLASKIEDPYQRAVLRWSAVMTMGASIIALLGPIGWLQESTYKYYLDRINQLGMFLFLVPAFIMYIFFALLPLLLVRFRQRFRGLLLAFAAMPMLLGFWVTFAITVGLWLVTATYTENQSNQLFDETSKTFWHLGFDYLFLIGIVLILAISYVRHQVRSRRATAGIGSDRFPRLILPGVLIPFVLLATVASMYGNWTCMRCWHPPCEQCFAPLGLTEWFLGNAWWVLLLGGFVIQVFPQGFKLANDIVNYFSDPIHRTNNPFYAISAAFKLRIGGPQSFRTQASNRLVAILTDLDETFGPIREIDVIAYSLGSMIAIDTLTSKATVLEDPSTRIRLFTLGSPYGNVFQYYFPQLFPDLTRERLANVSEVINVFRINDYVGTKISRTDDFVKDRCQPPRGHLGYFSDREVIKEVVDVRRSGGLA